VALVACITLTGIALVAIAAARMPGVAGAASASVVLSSSGDGGCTSLTTCYSARQHEAAFDILPLLEHGTNDHGETVVLPELAEPQFPLPTSDIRRDLAAYDKSFHLPAARLRTVSSLAPSASQWLANGEEVLDTEMVHAVAPGCSASAHDSSFVGHTPSSYADSPCIAASSPSSALAPTRTGVIRSISFSIM
jgi:hypothetical protein